MSSVFENIDKERVPRHVAIIMDGNRRWAKERGEETIVGHQQGVTSVRKASEAAINAGVEYLTLYAFSTENWNRSKEEVDFLMGLLVSTIEKETPDLNDKGIKLMTIGDINGLPKETRDKFLACMATTANNKNLNLVIALNYSSRWEITHAAKQIAEKIKNNSIEIDSIDEKLFSDYLTTSAIPDPELLIRTSGEIRLSNFLLWQLAYTELYFSDVYWPDFTIEDFYKALLEYQQRDRRFGK